MRKIIFVSRLDADCSLGASILCDIAPILHPKYPDLQIIIIGGGEKYPEIHKKSLQINEKINHQLIIALGNVDSPADYFEPSSLFVGVSRAALEAMAHSLPVILLGNEGFLGLLDHNTLKIAQKTNFTCRGSCNNMNLEQLKTLLLTEICHFFELPDKEKERLCNFSYQIVKNGYSAKEMAEKTIIFYEKTLTKYQKSCARAHSTPQKIAICGYYGHSNLGDEAILSSIRKKLLKYAPDSPIEVIGNKNPLKNLQALFKADLFIFGGGSLLQNSTSNASLFYYLATIHIANLLCKRKIMLANGIGPVENNFFTRDFMLKMISRAVNTFDFISVRDTDSQKLLSSLLPHRNIHLVPDPALMHAKEINHKLINERKKENFIYIPCVRGLKKLKISAESIAQTMTLIEKSFELSPLLVVLNPKEDLSFAKSVKFLMPNAKIFCPTTPYELFELFASAKFVISQRYHGSLFANACKVPTLSVSNDPKMHGLCKDFKLFPCQNTSILLSASEICQKITIMA